MRGRPVDHRRRAELLDAAVDYTADAGLAELSWRPVAAALDVSTSTLVHHFGTREHLLDAILARLRERITEQTASLVGSSPTLAGTARAVWEWTSHPDRGPTFRLFFAVYGAALQAPGPYADFLSHVGEDWMQQLRAVQDPSVDPATADRRATLVVATLRGLLLDRLSGGEPERVDGAAEDFLASLGDASPSP